MVFHGDYEVEFEIYEKTKGDWRSKLLGHMVGIYPDDAKARWVAAHESSDEGNEHIHAVPTWDE